MPAVSLLCCPVENGQGLLHLLTWTLDWTGLDWTGLDLDQEMSHVHVPWPRGTIANVLAHAPAMD